MAEWNQDDKGNDSSFRIVFVPFIIMITIAILVTLFVFVKESYQLDRDYNGLAQVISALLGGGILGMGAKALQKHFEK